MKCLYLLSIALLVVGSAFSQVTKYKAYEKYVDDFKQNKPVPDGNWDSTNVLVVMDFTKMKVKTFGQETGDFDLIELKNVKTVDFGKSWLYDAVDANGTKCIVVIQMFSDQTKRCSAALKIIYEDVGLYFRLETD